MKDNSDMNWLDLGPEEYKSILESSYDEISVIDANGIIVYINEACERNYGLKPSEMIGKDISELGAQGYYSPVIAPMVFKEKKRVTLEHETITGGKLVVTITPIFDNKGDIKWLVANSRDIGQIGSLKHDLQDTKNLLRKYKMEVEELKKKETFHDNLIVNSKQMSQCLELAQKVAPVDSTILILGESGTGKSLIAKHIHKLSERKGLFMSINCAAIPDHLLESELFGYRRGAFTGAIYDKAGLLELTHDGTIFLDEIGEIPLKLQGKLLEVIQEKQFIPLGGKEHKKINSRIIAATNRDLSQMVQKGEFREDLYYRLNVIELKIPSLRDRREDIPLMIKYFLDKFNKQYKNHHVVTPKCMDVLMKYAWPGNVRELEHVVERLVLTVQEEKINVDHLPEYFLQNQESSSETSIVPLDSAIEELKKDLILKAYKEFKSSYKVAEALNITQPRAYRMINKYISQE